MANIFTTVRHWAQTLACAITILSSLLLFILFTGIPAMAQDASPNLIEKILADHPQKFARFTQDPAKYRLQILLSVVNKDDAGKPVLERYGYRLEAEYFYPASSIKTYGAAAALIKLRELREQTGLPIRHDTPMVIHPLFDDEQLQDEDPSNIKTGKMTIEHEIRKTLLVSSNSAYNHLFEFVGHQKLHDVLKTAGLPQTRLNHRVEEIRSPEDNRRSPRIDFVLEDGRIYTIPQRTSTLITDNTGLKGLDIGKAYMSGGKRIEKPLNFLHKNHSSLEDLQNFLILITDPDLAFELTHPADGGAFKSHIPGLNLSDEDREILMDALSQHPHESKNPIYTEQDISEANGYPLFQWGLERLYPRKDLLLYAKGGTAYGFKIENAAVIHKPTGRTFFLAATLYCNPNETLNDDDYDYDTARAFLADLGEAVAREIWIDR